MADAQHAEVAGPPDGKPDLEHDLVARTGVRVVEPLVAAHEERLGGGVAEERAVAPRALQEGGDGRAQALIERLAARLVGGPARALRDRGDELPDGALA